jgi:predicted kinase
VLDADIVDGSCGRASRTRISAVHAEISRSFTTQRLVHLVCGPTGAGATTYARALSQRVGGVCFSLKEWMFTLFLMDTPEPFEANWARERVVRCLDQMWSIVEQMAALSIPCVLDFGGHVIDGREPVCKNVAPIAMLPQSVVSIKQERTGRTAASPTSAALRLIRQERRKGKFWKTSLAS